MFNEASWLPERHPQGGGATPVAWLSDPDLAIWSAVLANVWRGTAFSMILLYAGLVVIPASLYEAAEVDGANAFQQFRYITLPQLRPIADQHHPDQHLHAQHFRSHSPTHRRRASRRGPGALCLQHGFRNLDLSNGAVLAVLLAISIAFTFFYVRLLPEESDRVDFAPGEGWPIWRPMSPTASSACSSPGRSSG